MICFFCRNVRSDVTVGPRKFIAVSFRFVRVESIVGSSSAAAQDGKSQRTSRLCRWPEVECCRQWKPTLQPYVSDLLIFLLLLHLQADYRTDSWLDTLWDVSMQNGRVFRCFDVLLDTATTNSTGLSCVWMLAMRVVVVGLSAVLMAREVPRPMRKSI